MARQPEGLIKDSCRPIAKKHDLLFRQVEGKGFNGWPDTAAGKWPKGSGIVHIEFKRPDGPGPTEQQERRMQEIRDAGGETAVCRSVADYCAAIGLPL